MGEQSYALLDLGKPEEAAALVQDARAVRRLPGTLVAWLYTAEAETLAAAGDRPRSRAALRTAEKVFPATEDPELPFLAFDEAHLARWQGNVLRALGDRAAVSPLRAALQSMDGSFNRASASLHTDLAAVLVDVGDQDEAKQLPGNSSQRLVRSGNSDGYNSSVSPRESVFGLSLNASR
jgi:hypothetical protein